MVSVTKIFVLFDATCHQEKKHLLARAGSPLSFPTSRVMGTGLETYGHQVPLGLEMSHCRKVPLQMQ